MSDVIKNQLRVFLKGMIIYVLVTIPCLIIKYLDLFNEWIQLFIVYLWLFFSIVWMVYTVYKMIHVNDKD